MDRNHRLPTRLCLLLLGLASQTEAREPQSCASRLFDAVARQVDHNGRVAPSYEFSGPFLAMACKPWPNDPVQMAIAMAYLDPSDTATEGKRHPHLLLAKADSHNGRLLKHCDSDLEEDTSVAVGSDNPWLDAACYRLSPAVRAFDVVFHSVARGASYSEAGFDNLLALVVPAGDDKLRPVLNTYLDQQRALKGSTCSAEPRFEQEVSYLTLELGRGRPNGFADLAVTLRVSDGKTKNGKPLCTVKCTLHCNGRRYPFEGHSDLWYRR